MVNTNKLTWYTAGGAIGLVLGVSAYFAQPDRWMGQALVRVGQFSQSQAQSQGQSYNTSSIEPISTVVERLKSPSFVKAVAQRAKDDRLLSLLSVDGGGGMVVRPTRNSDSLAILVSADSEQLARVAIDAVVAELVSKHQMILNSYQPDAQKELVQLELQINALAQRMQSAADRQLGGDRAVAGLVIIATQPVLEQKIARTLALRESLSAANRRPTALLEATSVSGKRMFRSLWRTALLGLALGVLLSIAWLKVNEYRSTKE